MEKSVSKIIFSKLFILAIILLVLIIVNVLGRYLAFDFYQNFIDIVNSGIFLLVLILMLLGIGELFGKIQFPGNIPGPIFNAVAGIFVFYFILKVFDVIHDVVGRELFDIFFRFEEIIYLIIIVVIVLFGYISVFYSGIDGKVSKKKDEEIEEIDIDKKGDSKEKETGEKKSPEVKTKDGEKKKGQQKKQSNKNLSWDDVKKPFKEGFNNLREWLFG